MPRKIRGTVLFLISQAPPQLVLCPMEGTADGAFVDSSLRGDLGNGQLLEIVGNNGLTLELSQFLLDHPLDPLQLDMPRESGTQISIKLYISHSGNTPSRSNGLSVRQVRSSVSA